MTSQANVKANPNVTNIAIDTSQPQPLKGLKLKGVRPLSTVQVELKDGSIITINKKGRKKFLTEHSGSKLAPVTRVPVEDEEKPKPGTARVKL